MNRRSFFGRFGAVATVAAVPSALTVQPTPMRRALQGGMPQCPECLDVLRVDDVPRDDAGRRAWASQETHVLHCSRCHFDVLWRTLL